MVNTYQQNDNPLSLLQTHIRNESRRKNRCAKKLSFCCLFRNRQLATTPPRSSLYQHIERFVLQLKDKLNPNDLNRLFLEVFFGRTLTLLAIISSVCMMNWWPCALATFIFPRTVLLLPDILRFYERAKHVFSRARLRAHSLLSPTDQLNRPFVDVRLTEALLSVISSLGNILACIGFVYSFFNVSSIQIAQIDEENVRRLPNWLRPPTGDTLLFYSPLILSVLLELVIITIVCVLELVRAKILQQRIARLNQTPREGLQVASVHISRCLSRISVSRWFSWFAGVEVACIYVFVCSLNASIDPRTASLSDRAASLETAKIVLVAASSLAIILYGSLALASVFLFLPVCVKTWMRYIVKAWRHSEAVEIEVESYHRQFRIAAAREEGLEPLPEDVLEVARERQNHFRPRTESELRLTLLRVLRYRANWWLAFCLFLSSSTIAGCSGYLLSVLQGRAFALVALFKRQLDESSGGSGGSSHVVNRTFKSILNEAADADNAVTAGSPLGSSTIKISVWLIVLNGLVLGCLLLLAHALQSVWSADTQAMMGGLTESDDNGVGGGRIEEAKANGANDSIKQQLPLFLERIQDGVYRRIEEDRIARRSGLLVITNPLHCLADVKDALDRRKSKTAAVDATVAEIQAKAIYKEKRKNDVDFPSSPRNAPPFSSRDHVNLTSDKHASTTTTDALPSTFTAPSLALLNAASVVHVHVSPLHTMMSNRNPLIQHVSAHASSSSLLTTSTSLHRPGLVKILDKTSVSSSSSLSIASRASHQSKELTLRNVVINARGSSQTSLSTFSPSSLRRPCDKESKEDSETYESTNALSLRAEPVQDVTMSSSTSSSSLSSSSSLKSPAAVVEALLHQQQTPRRHEPRPPCYICMETAADSVFLECGHGGVCGVCAGIIMRGKLEMHRASISSNGLGLVLVDDGEEDHQHEEDGNSNAATLGHALTNAFGGGIGRRTLATAEAAATAAAATAATTASAYDSHYSMSSQDGGSTTNSLRWPIYSGGTGTCPMCRATVTSVVRIGPDVAMTDGRIVALILPHSYWRDGEYSPRLVVSNGVVTGSKLGLTLTPRTLWATATTTEELELSGATSERFRL
jgi:hypothetical protein